MSLDTTIIVHECNVIRRRIQEEFKNLTLNFIVYNADDDHSPAITDLVNQYRKEIQIDLSNLDFKNDDSFTLQGSCFLGINVTKKKNGILPIKATQYEAIFFINSSVLTDKTRAQFNINHLCWHAIRLYRKVVSNKHSQSEFIKMGFEDFATRLRENLLADIFSAIILQKYGHVISLNKLARLRCQDLFSVNTNYVAENYPFPIACEATTMLLDENSDNDITQSKRPLSNIIELTHEVKETFDDNAIEQWFQFAKSAQDMVWKGADKNRVLQTAVYTCEDPFVRSVAYLVSELLNIDPHPVSDTHYHNPFTDEEANERLHYKLCRNQLKDILNNTDSYLNKNSFVEKINTLITYQNQQLQNGIIIGWCVPALIESISKYNNLLKDEGLKEQQRLNITLDTHQKKCSTPPWIIIKELGAKIINRKRKGLQIDRDYLIGITSSSQYTNEFKKAFDKL